MLEILAQTTLSEIMLLFVLLFILPATAYLLLRLRRYESRYGLLTNAKGGKKKAPPPEPVPAAEAKLSPSVPADSFPYRSRLPLSAAELSCLAALRGALGPDVEVFPKVALWEVVEATEKDPGYFARLTGKACDFLVCDRKTGRPLTAVMFKPGKGRPAGPLDELGRICAAAQANVVFIDMAEEYDAGSLKKALGIPELDL